MDFQALYLTGDGRISRKTWWIGTLVLFAASIVLYIVLGLFGLGLMSSWGPLLVYAILFYPALNLGVKRRHDRDNDGNDYRILMGVSALVTLLQAFGIGFSRVDLGNGFTGLMPDMWMSIVQIGVAIYGIYLLVQLGFLRGAPGPNSYGPDPLGYATA
jgi:uncharacterized membrane protein YhaH (DUF805 family)